MFTEWVQAEHATCISEATARRWLSKLGFSHVHHQKGVYFDEHERNDVVDYRNEFLQTMNELDKISITCDGNTPELNNGEKPLICVVHDECTYYANSDQTYFWADKETNVLRQKSLGASIMVSDFVDEVAGYVRDLQDQARLLLETQREGYFKNDLLMTQVAYTVDIFERAHPEARAIFLFDNAPSHHKFSNDTPNADRMNIGPGGKQPKMRDTQWAGGVQKLVDEHGVPKGMKTVLEERGVDTTRMKADDMRLKLKTYTRKQFWRNILKEGVTYAFSTPSSIMN